MTSSHLWALQVSREKGLLQTQVRNTSAVACLKQSSHSITSQGNKLSSSSFLPVRQYVEQEMAVPTTHISSLFFMCASNSISVKDYWRCSLCINLMVVTYGRDTELFLSYQLEAKQSGVVVSQSGPSGYVAEWTMASPGSLGYFSVPMGSICSSFCFGCFFQA